MALLPICVCAFLVTLRPLVASSSLGTTAGFAVPSSDFLPIGIGSVAMGGSDLLRDLLRVLTIDGARDEATEIGSTETGRDGTDGGTGMASTDTGLGSEGSRIIGIGEALRDPGGITGGRAALVVRDLDLGTKASGIGAPGTSGIGCTDAALETTGVEMTCCTAVAPGGGGGGGGMVEDDAAINSSFPFCFIISIISFIVSPIS